MDKIIKYGIVIFMISVLVGYFIGKFYPILFGKSEGNSVVIENIAGNTIEFLGVFSYQLLSKSYLIFADIFFSAYITLSHC